MTTTHHERLDESQPTPPTRSFAAVIFVALAGVVAVLSFADRAPAIVGGALRAGSRLSNDAQAAVGVSVFDARDLPYSWDVVGHFVLWLTVAFIGRWAFRRRTSALGLAAALFATSYAVEIGQLYLSTTRRPDLQDLTANGLGIAVGIAAMVVIERVTAMWHRSVS